MQDYEFVVYRDNRNNVASGNGLKITPQLLRDEFGANYVKQGNLTLKKYELPKNQTCCLINMIENLL